MIAIASSASPNPTAASSTLNIAKWNAGLVDRHLKTKNIGFTKTALTRTEKPVSEKTLNRYQQFIDTLAQEDNNFYIGYDRETVEGYKEVHEELMGQFLYEITEELNLNSPGLIPFELSFTIKGISGIKIGQAFKVNEFFLPERYRGKVGFIVTGIDHTISNGRWTTSIKSQITVI
jgi:hypothetical protein